VRVDQSRQHAAVAEVDHARSWGERSARDDPRDATAADDDVDVMADAAAAVDDGAARSTIGCCAATIPPAPPVWRALVGLRRGPRELRGRPPAQAVQQERRPLGLHGERFQIDALTRRMRAAAQRAESVEPVDERRDERDVARPAPAGIEGATAP